MNKPVLSRLLGLLRVPPEPTPPTGDPDSVIVFRAAHNFFRYQVARWLFTQLGALIGLVVGVLLIRTLPDVIFAGYRWVVVLVEAAAWIGYLVQLPVTYALLHLDYEQRWYILTDRSIRIREGLATVREQTMTLANVQNMSIRQGPLQRLLSIADLEVHAAGGRGGGDGVQESSGKGMHVGTFRGIDNAVEVRDLIRGAVRRYRDTGLGDPDDSDGAVPAADRPTLDPSDSARLAAAKEVLAEVKALRTQMR